MFLALGSTMEAEGVIKKVKQYTEKVSGKIFECYILHTLGISIYYRHVFYNRAICIQIANVGI